MIIAVFLLYLLRTSPLFAFWLFSLRQEAEKQWPVTIQREEGRLLAIPSTVARTNFCLSDSVSPGSPVIPFLFENLVLGMFAKVGRKATYFLLPNAPWSPSPFLFKPCCKPCTYLPSPLERSQVRDERRKSSEAHTSVDFFAR